MRTKTSKLVCSTDGNSRVICHHSGSDSRNSVETPGAPCDRTIKGNLNVCGNIINPGFQTLQGQVTCLDDGRFGTPNSAQTEQQFDEQYPSELANQQNPNVYMSQAVIGNSRLPASLSALRVCDSDIQSSGGTVFRNIAGECYIDVNPTDPQNIVIVAHQDRWTGAPFIFGGIFLSTAIAYTTDGGQSWTQPDISNSKIQGSTNPFGFNDWDSASDPNVVFDNAGNVYHQFLGFNIFQNYEEAIGYVKSNDKGKSWSKPYAVWRDDGNSHFQERTTLNADPYQPNTIYAVWPDEIPILGGNSAPVYFQKSTDGGLNWTAPIAALNVSVNDVPGAFPWGPIVKVLPDHTLVMCVCVGPPGTDPLDPTLIENFYVSRSTDGGLTWTQSLAFSAPQGAVLDPDNGTNIWAFLGGIDVAINQTTGQLYGVYQTYRNSKNTSEIVTSTDGGFTWSAPIEISNTQPFYPTVAVASDGSVGVMYADFSNHSPGSSSLETDVYIKVFSSDLTTVEQDTRLTPISFDYRQAIWRLDNLFLGDYWKLQNDPSNNDFVGVMTITNPPYGIGPTPMPQPGNLIWDVRNRQSAYFVRLSR